MRVRLVAVAVVALTGCSSTVAGAGRFSIAPRPVAPSAGSSASSALPSSPSDLRRVDEHDFFGDPVTANYCPRIWTRR